LVDGGTVQLGDAKVRAVPRQGDDAFGRQSVAQELGRVLYAHGTFQRADHLPKEVQQGRFLDRLGRRLKDQPGCAPRDSAFSKFNLFVRCRAIDGDRHCRAPVQRIHYDIQNASTFVFGQFCNLGSQTKNGNAGRSGGNRRLDLNAEGIKS
jgi:hypothetical protein